MARNRMIKPEFFSDEKVSKLPLGARLLFIGLWNFSDDCGVCHNNYRKILGDIFPNDDDITARQVKNWVDFLIKGGFVAEIEFNSTKFLKIKNWGRHQIVANPSKKQWIPDEKLETLIRHKLDTKEEFLIKDKEKDKEKDKVLPPNGVDFINELIIIFSEEYNKAFGFEYIVTNKGKERSAAGKILSAYKKKNNTTKEKTIADFRNLFKAICTADYSKNAFLAQVSLPFINSQLNKYLQFLHKDMQDKTKWERI